MSTKGEISNVSMEESDADDEITQKIVLHVYNDESKEFTSLTTYHGMSGSLIYFYISHPTFLDTKQMETNLPKNLIPTFTLCSRIRGLSTVDSWKKLNCIDQFHTVYSDQRKVENFCDKHTQKKIMKSGICHRILGLEVQLQDEFTAVVANSVDYDLSFGISKPNSNFSTTELFVPQGMELNLEITVRSRMLLDGRYWGRCKDNVSEIPDCEETCLREKMIEFCSCLPDYLVNETNTVECTTNSSKLCIRKIMSQTSCNCYLPCHRVTYDVVRSSLLKLQNGNYSKIRVGFHRKWIFEEQRQRARTIDVLCWIGGSMGLFLGTSCVTLMEIFVFLFKSAWGITNNQRHKDYLSNLLGENVTGLLNDNEEVNRSHETIVITQTVSDSGHDDTEAKKHSLAPLTLHFMDNKNKKRVSIKINDQEQDSEKCYAPSSQQRFRAYTNKSLISSLDCSEIPSRPNLKRTRTSSYKSLAIGDF